MTFRKDINGLRAIAVIAVVLFHFNQNWMPGGFAGVDVFFVISGFLMTGIIFKGFEQNNFSIIRFYLARFNRIIPALLVLCIVVIINFFILSPIEYFILNKHSSSSATFISNILYWKESGSYFDVTSKEKWLLHTWSLSVELQFYILYPISLIIIKQIFSLRIIKIMILLGTIILFIFSVYATYRYPNASYYLLPTRAWEMTIGGVAFLYPLNIKNLINKYLEIIGVFLILISYLFVTSNNLWPGYLALIPVFGAILIIQANRNENSILKSSILQNIGLWSYSIYLWHWPIVVLISRTLEYNIYIYLIGIMVSILLGCLSYKYIEKIKSYLIKVIIIIIFSIITLLIYITNGAEFRVDESHRYSDIEKIEFKYGGGTSYKVDEFYTIGNKDNIKYIFFGDSYGQQYESGINQLISNNDKGILAYFFHGCFISPNLTRFVNGIENIRCSKSFEQIVKKAEKYPEAKIIIASSWNYKHNHGFKGKKSLNDNISNIEWQSMLTNELDIIISSLGHNRKYYLVGQPQRDLTKSYDCLNKAGMKWSNSCYNFMPKRTIDINNFLLNYSSNRNNIKYFDINNFLCENNQCLVSDGRFPIYNDGSHISIFGSKFVSSYFLDSINYFA